MLGTLFGAFYLVSNLSAWSTRPTPDHRRLVQALTVNHWFLPTWCSASELLGKGYTGLFAGAMKLSEAMDATEPEPEAEDTEEDEAKPATSPEPL